MIISWKYFGFHMVIMLAGLQGIPRELEEAAYIDGANRRQAIRYVTLPLLGPTIRVSVFLSIIGALQLFDMIWVMTGGGPVNASSTMAIDDVRGRLPALPVRLRQRARGHPLHRRLVVALLYQRFVLRRDTDGAVTARAARMATSASRTTRTAARPMLGVQRGRDA